MEDQILLNVNYELNYDEILESLRVLMYRFSTRSYSYINALLFGIGLIFLILYAFEPSRVDYFFLILIDALTLLFIHYYPELKARRSAGRLSSMRGTFKVSLYSDGKIQPGEGKKISLSNDNRARAIETNRMFVIRPDRFNTFAIPKRVMAPEEIELIRDLLKSHLNNFTGGS